jgi:hypothetical protein
MRERACSDDLLRPEHVRIIRDFFEQAVVLEMMTIRIGDEPCPPAPQPPICLNGLRRSKRFARLEVVR